MSVADRPRFTKYLLLLAFVACALVAGAVGRLVAADTIANAALFYGLVQVLATDPQPPESRLAFDRARANFYAAAKDGLRARLVWLDGREAAARAKAQAK